MLASLSDHVKNCLERADEANSRARETSNPTLKADFLNLERSWRCLAQSYQQSERLERFLLDRNKTRSFEWQPISAAPFDRDLELAVLERQGAHALVFPCRRILGGWIKAENKERIEVNPTHWREWQERSPLTAN
jgi:hypothetical protein